MTLDEFRNDFLNEIHFNATENKTTPRDEFLAMYATLLSDAEEFNDFEQIFYEGTGSKSRKLQIDGYCFDPLENCLIIAICLFDDSPELNTLTLTEAKTYFKRASSFIEDSWSGFIQKYAEESSPGYGLAVDIQKRYSSAARYKIYLLTDKSMSSRILEIPESESHGIPTEYHIWDINRLYNLSTSKTGKEDIVIDLTEYSPKGIPCLFAGQTEDYTGYLCSIPGSVLAKLYNTYGGRLLEGNVRSFLTAKGKINKGIRNTILNEPGMFFAYNNGIAATAYEVDIKNGPSGSYITKLKSLQIVNGGQTTASLAAALINDSARANGLKDIYVPMKISVVTPEKAMTLIPNIAKYANKQNKVSDADFFSNHAFHIRMEDFSRRLIAPAINGNQYGTYWYYERIRGQYKQDQSLLTKAEKNKFLLRYPKQQMFTKTDLAKFYNLYRLLPHQVCMGAQKNFIAFAEWASTAWDKDETQFNEHFFKQIVCLDILFRKADSIIKSAPWYEKGYKAQTAAYTLAYFFYRIHKDCPDQSFDFKTVWNRQGVSSIVEEELSSIAHAMYNLLTSSDREVQNVTEWAKKEDCWKKAKNCNIPLSTDLKCTLISKEEETEEKKNARIQQKEDNKIAPMIQVVQFGVEKWKNLLTWGMDNHIFSSQEISFIKAAIAMERGKMPSEKQCARIIQILQKARDESYPG